MMLGALVNVPPMRLTLRAVLSTQQEAGQNGTARETQTAIRRVGQKWKRRRELGGVTANECV